ncbi:hypothetical protein [Paractinoplanes rishiriensis]|uniref:hypothetical protein n=1 Tax=Paractinoplanes rishiriensis TaxID=1050105 RepID=UPI0019413353|nr:hypothetical protein [Actinoplanes rishiriensis]
MSNDAAAIWDRQAATFDDEPDHGLRDPAVRDAWIALLTPVPPALRKRSCSRPVIPAGSSTSQRLRTIFE